HGRGLWILDDITPLRHLTRDVLDADAAFLPARPSVRTIPAGLQEFPGDDRFAGGNPTSVATITYYLKKRHMFGDLKVEVYDPDGKLVATLPGGRRVGINRVSWFMRRKPPKVPPAPQLAGRALFGPMVPAGTYTVKLFKGAETYEGRVEVIPDATLPHSAADQELQAKTVLELYDMQQELGYLADLATAARDRARERVKDLGKGKLPKDLEAFASSVDALHKTMVATREGFLTGEEQLRERVVDLYGAISEYGGRPSPAQLGRLSTLQEEMTRVRASLDAEVKKLDALNASLKDAGKEPIVLPTREEFEGREEGSAPAGLVASAPGSLAPLMRTH
ncbi:MAG: glycosyl hydrolase, partial [Acidobacteriota bacterium]